MDNTLTPVRLRAYVLLLFIYTPAHSDDLAWDEPNTQAFIEGCILGIVDPARRDYFARAQEKGNRDPKPFPEEELIESVRPMCSCMAEKFKANSIPPDETSLQSSEASAITQEAIESGECKLGGRFGEAMSRQAPKQ